MPDDARDDDLAHHARLHDPVSDCPLLEGNRVTLLPTGADAIRAVLDAVEAARDHIHLEYYTVEDLTLDGRSLFSLLEAKARAGVEVALIWDAVGSDDTPDEQFARLEAAGVQTLEYHSLNPMRRASASASMTATIASSRLSMGRSAFSAAPIFPPSIRPRKTSGAARIRTMRSGWIARCASRVRPWPRSRSCFSMSGAVRLVIPG